MNLSTNFLYDFSLVLLSHPSLLWGVVGTLIALILTILIYGFSYLVYGMLLLHRDEVQLVARKSMLQELILMKDLQTEIEKEIERAMINESFAK